MIIDLNANYGQFVRGRTFQKVVRVADQRNVPYAIADLLFGNLVTFKKNLMTEESIGPCRFPPSHNTRPF